MKMRLTKLAVVVFLLTGMGSVFAQSKYGSDPDACKMNLSLFHESVKAKNFKEAMEPWKACYTNCPKASKHIYTDGIKIAKNLIKNGDNSGVALVNEIYKKRIEVFPTNLGKVYNDWAKFLISQNASDDEVFEKLNLAFKSDPAGMSAKNIFRFFKKITEKYKDTDVQYIFDTMDDVNDAVNKKMDKYTREYDAINTKIKNGVALSSKEEKRVKSKFYEINLSGLGKIEGGLNSMVNDLMTCDRLVPLYRKDYETKKTDAKWLKRAAKKLNDKGCKNDPLFGEIVESWVNLEPTANSLNYYASILEKKGEMAKSKEYRDRAFNAETDPYKKAKIVYNRAIEYKQQGKLSLARKTAYKALKIQPSFGKAYLLIGSMYAKSANSVGTDEFSKRMVYVAAAAKMNQAKKADPSLTSRANKFLKSYRANFPKTKLLFNLGKKSGDSYKIGGWIGETVRIP